MLQLDPNKRITAQDALEHPYFKIDPKPATPEEIEEIINIDVN
jgi:serine/threonine protein kinase